MVVDVIPDLHKLAEDGLDNSQLYAFAIFNLVLMVLYAAVLALTLHNIWAFLIKQRKYRAVPLTMIYVLTVLLCCLRITLLYFFVELYSSGTVASQTAFLKLAIGWVQIWMLIELSLKLRLIIKLY